MSILPFNELHKAEYYETYDDGSYFYRTKKSQHYIVDNQDILAKIRQNGIKEFNRISKFSFYVGGNSINQLYFLSNIN